MSKFITVYVPISKYVKAEIGEDHIIANFAKAISRETYNKLRSENAMAIQNKIQPIIDDLQGLIDSLNAGDFTYEVDQNQVTIFHEYCPTLDKDHVVGTGKEYKGLDSVEKVKILLKNYIAVIIEQRNRRIQQAHDVIADFEYHPIQIDADELDLMVKDDSYTFENIIEANSDPVASTDISEAETREAFINTAVTDPEDPYDNPIDHMDR